jgi:hypothetical protein
VAGSSVQFEDLGTGIRPSLWPGPVLMGHDTSVSACSPDGILEREVWRWIGMMIDMWTGEGKGPDHDGTAQESLGVVVRSVSYEVRAGVFDKHGHAAKGVSIKTADRRSSHGQDNQGHLGRSAVWIINIYPDCSRGS